MRDQEKKRDVATAAKVAADPIWVRGLLGYPERQIRAQDEALRAILALPESVTSFDQMVVVGRAAAQRVVQEQRDQEEREHAQQREQQDRLKREREIDGYLGEVLRYLLERAREPRDIKFAAGESFELAPKIKAAIKPQLLFSIYSEFPKLDVAGSIPVSRSMFFTQQTRPRVGTESQ